MSDQQQPTTTQLPRIIPPHPRFPGRAPEKSESQLRPVKLSPEKLKEVAAADQAEQVVIAKLSKEMGSVVLFSDQSSNSDTATDTEPLKTLGPLFPSSKPLEEIAHQVEVESDEKEEAEEELPLVSTQSKKEPEQEEVPAIAEEAKEAKEEKRSLETLKKNRPKEVAVSGEVSPFNNSRQEDRKGFWERLGQRRKELAGDVDEDGGPDVEPWVDGIEESSKSGPTVRAGADDMLPPEWQGTRSVFGRKLKAFAAAAMFCALGCGVWIFWKYDGAAPDDNNLAPIALETNHPNDVHKRLAKFLNDSEKYEVSRRITEMPRLTDADTDTLDDLLRKNTAALKLIIDCLEQDNWEPRHPVWASANLGSELPWRELSLIKQAEAIHLQRSGFEVSAFRAGFDLMEFGKKVQELKAWPNYFLTGVDIYQRGVETVKILIDHTRMNSDQLGALQRTFASSMHQPPTRADLEAFFRASYGLEKTILTEAGTAPPRPGISSYLIARPNGMTFKRNRTLNLFADAFSTLIHDTKNPLSEPNKSPVDRSESENPSLLDSNRSGRQYFAKVMKAYLDAPAKQAKSATDFNLVKTRFAIRRFNLDTGRLPETLAELSPNYLKGIPSDPFNGDTLRYSKVKKVVYSAGVNGIDEGGASGRLGFMNNDEPTLELVFSSGEFH